jgi:DNA-binding GntR family transcriptional regulator
MPRHVSELETARPEAKLREQLYESIRKSIISCEIAPGSPLNEGVIAQRYQVSKTPVREALTSLVQHNLVEYVPNRGFSVTSISLKDIQEIFEARLFYETLLIQLAIPRITEAEIQKLETLNQIVYDWNKPITIEQYIDANTEFHMTIAQAARNSRLIRHYSNLLDEAQRLIYMDLKYNAVLHTWQRSHQGLVEALKNRDEEAGKKAVEEIMANGKKRILGLEEYT